MGTDARVALIDLEAAGLSGARQVADLAAAGVPVGVLDRADRQELSALAPERRTAMAVGRVLLRFLLSERDGGTPAAEWRLVRAATGQLRVAGPGRPACISVSRAEGMVAVAVGPDPIGVDVDAVPHEVASALAGNPELFAAQERELLAQVPRAGLADAVGRAWTLKEAAAKADGSGVLSALARIHLLTTLDGADPQVEVESWCDAGRPVAHQWPVDGRGVRNWLSVVELPPA